MSIAQANLYWNPFSSCARKMKVEIRCNRKYINALFFTLTLEEFIKVKNPITLPILLVALTSEPHRASSCATRHTFDVPYNDDEDDYYGDVATFSFDRFWRRDGGDAAGKSFNASGNRIFRDTSY